MPCSLGPLGLQSDDDDYESPGSVQRHELLQSLFPLQPATWQLQLSKRFKRLDRMTLGKQHETSYLSGPDDDLSRKKHFQIHARHIGDRRPYEQT